MNNWIIKLSRLLLAFCGFVGGLRVSDTFPSYSRLLHLLSPLSLHSLSSFLAIYSSSSTHTSRFGRWSEVQSNQLRVSTKDPQRPEMAHVQRHTSPKTMVVRDIGLSASLSIFITLVGDHRDQLIGVDQWEQERESSADAWKVIFLASKFQLLSMVILSSPVSGSQHDFRTTVRV